MTPTQSVVFLAVLSALLIVASVYALADAETREEAEPMRLRQMAIDRVMTEAMTDDHRCSMCHRVSAVRELVPLHDDAALCCAGCAELLRLNRLGRAA